MSSNPPVHILGKKQLWYLTTVCGFALGFVMGADILRPSHPWHGPWLEPIFWALPAAGAGFGMGLGQWVLIRQVHKTAFLWIIATTFGVISNVGGTLLLTLSAATMATTGSLEELFRYFVDWFIPWIKLLIILAPAAIIFGALLQWLIVRHATKSQSFKKLLKLSVGWIFSIVALFMMLGLIGAFVHTRNDIINLLALIAATIPSGLIFAYFTQDIFKNPLSERRGL